VTAPAGATTLPANTVPDTEQLVAVLRTESRLLDELARVLRRQREGITRDDVETVDESVVAAHRVMGTLKEAQRQRHTLLELMTGTQGAGLDQLEDALGPAMTDDVASVRDQLNAHARSLAREIRINREVLQGAMEHGSRMIHVLRGAITESAMPAAPLAAEPAGTLIDRCV
jgi:hypothetical protein